MEKENVSIAKAHKVEKDFLMTIHKTIVWTIFSLLFLALVTLTHAQQADQQQLAFNISDKSQNSKTVFLKQSQENFNVDNLSDQQMIDFFKNENQELNEEINELINKVNPNAISTLAADEAIIARLAILKNKLEYFEIILTKWINQGDF